VLCSKVLVSPSGSKVYHGKQKNDWKVQAHPEIHGSWVSSLQALR